MSLTKFLCECFDVKKRGYVTIGDVLPILLAILLVLTFIGIFCLYLYGAYNVLFNNISPDITLSFLDSSSLFAFLIITSFLIFGLTIYLCYLISKIKIAECKYE